MTNPRIGIVWAYRLVLDRDPIESEIQFAQQTTNSAKDVCQALIHTQELVTQLNIPNRNTGGIRPEEERDAVLWAFRLLLGRDLLDEGDIQSMTAQHFTVAQLRNTLLLSEEFRLLRDESLYPLLVNSVIREFKPICTSTAASGSFNDFLGTTTRCSFLPPNYASISGAILGPPGALASPPLHDAAEWVGTLRAVLEATNRFTVVELGAGWAPWLVSGHNAALRRGISEINLMGVEGSLEHVDYMRQHFVDNGLDPNSHKLIHGVVGVKDGVARFPKLAKPDEDYGAAADYLGNASARAMVEVPCFSLRTLLSELPPVVDLIHCDVQGAEAEVMGAALPSLNERVRRVVIGTHGRKIEGLLLEQFSGLGWRLEYEGVCTYQQSLSGKLTLTKDGEQVWRNPHL